jgi:hypothetical protein
VSQSVRTPVNPTKRREPSEKPTAIATTVSHAPNSAINTQKERQQPQHRTFSQKFPIPFLLSHYRATIVSKVDLLFAMQGSISIMATIGRPTSSCAVESGATRSLESSKLALLSTTPKNKRKMQVKVQVQVQMQNEMKIPLTGITRLGIHGT